MKDITREDLLEFEQITQSVIIEGAMGKRREYFEELGNELQELGVFYAFDEAKEMIFLTVPRYLKSNTMTFADMAKLCKRGVHPASLACAIKAWMVDPNIFDFWGTTEEPEYDED
jgi:hypothetical protein